MSLNTTEEINTFVCEDCKEEKTCFYEYRDDYRHLTICEDCFNNQFALQAKAKNKDWFTNNFNNPGKEFPKLKIGNWR